MSSRSACRSWRRSHVCAASRTGSWPRPPWPRPGPAGWLRRRASRGRRPIPSPALRPDQSSLRTRWRRPAPRPTDPGRHRGPEPCRARVSATARPGAAPRPSPRPAAAPPTAPSTGLRDWPPARPAIRNRCAGRRPDPGDCRRRCSDEPCGLVTLDSVRRTRHIPSRRSRGRRLRQPGQGRKAAATTNSPSGRAVSTSFFSALRSRRGRSLLERVCVPSLPSPFVIPGGGPLGPQTRNDERRGWPRSCGLSRESLLPAALPL